MRCLLGFLAFALTSTAAGDEPLKRIRVSASGDHFVRVDSDTPFVLRGFNYDHDGSGRLLEDYWHDDWQTVVEDFREMKALGCNAVRVHLQLPKFMASPTEADQRNLKQLDKLIKLAEQTGLYLNLTGLGCYHKADVPEWYDELSDVDRWAVQTRFWRAVAGVARSSDAVFCYDLMNEPVLPGKNGETEWLTGELGGKHFVQRISLDLAGRSRQDVARSWVETLTTAIREVDEKTLLTVGVIPWSHVWPNAKPIFYSPAVGEQLDFVSVHFYPRSGEVEKAIDALKVYELGKPLVVEEFFPLKCSHAEMQQFVTDSQPLADGWFSFYWGTTPDEYAAEDDLKSAIVGDWLRAYPDMIPQQ